MTEEMVFRIAKEAMEAGWNTAINFDTGVLIFTSDDMHSHTIKIQPIKLNDIWKAVDKHQSLYSPKATAARYISESSCQVNGLTSEDILDIYAQAEAIKKKLIDLKIRLKELKKSDA